MRILLITPPMVQVNAPYPATPYLAGLLARRGHDVHQADASLMLATQLFSRRGIGQIRGGLRPRARSASIRHFLQHHHEYANTIEAVIHFLQGHDPSLALRIVSQTWLPEGPRFKTLQHLGQYLRGGEAPFSTHDFAVHLASLYLDDLADTIHDGVDSCFELSRYGESLAASAPTFDGLAAALRRRPTLIDAMTDDITHDLIRRHQPELAGITVPFPGNVYAGLRMARLIKRHSPGTTVVMGGGYVNTELRQLSDPRIFDHVDYITLDDGDAPLLRVIDHVTTTPAPSRHSRPRLERTFYRHGNRVRYSATTSSDCHPAPPSHPTPLFSGLPLGQYFSMMEDPNPMHRIWSCGRWNKLTLAHGCYWHQCAFCDTQLDYIRRYARLPTDRILDQIEAVIAQTGQTGFHFVDEAMPPALLRSLSEGLIKRRLPITWWGNIRFDKAFTPELAELMADAGCIAVTGGLEAATDRLLSFLMKGFTLDQAARVTHTFAGADIMVHAYLMYGCPSQTMQDTVDSLEYVRQLFESGCIQSAYWHRFALTVHSPIYQNPAHYGIRLRRRPKSTFALNEVPYEDSVACDHAALGVGLRKALYNYMHHVGLDSDLQEWFSTPIPPPALPTDFVTQAFARPSARISE